MVGILRTAPTAAASDTSGGTACAIVGRVPRALRLCFYALAGALLALGAVGAAWAADARAHEGKVLRRVTLAGRHVGNLPEARLAVVVAEVAAEVPTRQVEVHAPEGGFTTDAEALGVRVSEAATVRAALAVGRTGSAPERIAAWIGSLRGERRAPVRVTVDSDRVFATVASKDPGPRTPPTEPSIAFAKGELSAVAGKPGRGIDARDVIAALPGAATDGRTMVVSVERGEVEPRYPVAAAERLAAEVEREVSEPLAVRAGGTAASVPVATQRSWIASRADDEGLHPTVDRKQALRDLQKLLSDAGEPAVETRFTVEGNAVQIVEGRNGTRCCADEAAAMVEAALFGPRPDRALELPMTTRVPDLTVDEARALGVIEPIASFTTKHPGRQPRVSNIHRISDVLRGTLIKPGATFSVNDTVGRRTADKGYVAAPVIEDGKFSESIGGGISQFATTLFNAAFEGGLEFGAYQSHSIYISRYPFGREATLSYPAPDLEIKNPSPHGVLLWPTYTETSITVTLYSTKFAEVRQSGQSVAPRGACKRVSTERTRTFLADNRTVVDNVHATYRPAEGVNC